MAVSSLAASLLVAGNPPSALADPEPAPSPAPAVTEFPRPKDPDAPLRAAIEEARKQNKPVAVESVYTETSRTWAYPDGHLTTDSYSGPSQLKQPDGSWAWIDTTLVEQGGVLRPKLAMADMEFSAGGGDKPFASMERDKQDQRFSLDWPTPLPKPTLAGNAATYTDAAGPGADLVVTALPTGFRHDVVLRSKPSGPVELRIPVQTEGLTFKKAKRGELKLQDDSGKTVAQAPAPVAIDGSALKTDNTGKITSRPQVGDIATRVTVENGKPVLVLKPDPEFLADPATTYPVTVDPTTTLTLLSDTWVSSRCGYGDPAQELMIGMVNIQCRSLGDTTAKPSYHRSLLHFDTAPLVGKAIASAQLELYARSGPACDLNLGGVKVLRNTSASWTSPAWAPDAAEAGSQIQLCPTYDQYPRLFTWSIRDIVSAWAAGSANHGLQVRGVNETDKHGWVVFHSSERTGADARPPKLTVSYMLPPEIPTVTAESIDSMDGNDAIARSQQVKVGFKSSVAEGTKLDYTVSVNDSTMATPPTVPTGEAAYWKFDEASGTTATDSSGKGRNLTLGSTVTRSPGQLGGALTFPKGAIATTSGPVLNTDADFSVSTWVRLDGSSGHQTVFSQSGTAQSGMALAYVDSPGNPDLNQKWWFGMSANDTSATAHTVAYSDKPAKINTWTHVVAVHDATARKLRLYVDGVLAAERDHTSTWNAQGAFTLGKGRIIGIEGSFSGAVDDMHVYDRVLTADDVRALYGVPTATSYNGIPSGQVIDKVFALDNPASFKFVVKACRTGVTPPSCNESPAYRITSDAPVLPTDTETGMADPARPILSGMVNRPSGGPVTAKYYLYDSTGAPVGSSPLGELAVVGGQRASFKIATNIVQSGRAYKWQMQACAQEVCTSKTEPTSFTVPGEAPPEEYSPTPIALQRDHFVTKTAKIDPAACEGGACMFNDNSTIQVGGPGEAKLASLFKVRLDEIPAGSIPVESLLDLGTPDCGDSTCPSDATIKITRLDNEVTAATKPSDLVRSTDSSSVYSIPAASPRQDIVGDEMAWLLVESDSEVVISFGSPDAAAKLSLTVGYLPPGPPSKVRNLLATPGDGGALATWVLPETNGSLAFLDGYDVQVLTPDGEIIRTVQAKDPSVTVTGLSNGTNYTLQVAARTRFGKSEWESVTVTPKRVELPPQQPGAAACPSSVDTERLTVKVEDYYNIQSGVIEGQYPDVWSGNVHGSTQTATQLDETLHPSHPMAAKLALTNTSLISAKQNMHAESRRREGSSVSISNAVAYNAPDGDVILRATVQHKWTDVATAGEDREVRHENSAGGTYDFSFGKCGGSGTHISVSFEADTRGMDMVLEGPGPGGECKESSVAKSTPQETAAKLAWPGCPIDEKSRGPNPNDVTAYQQRCAGDGCMFDTYAKRSVRAGMTLETGGVLRYKGYHNWIVGGPTAIDITDLRGWARINTTSAFTKSKKNKSLLNGTTVKLETIAGFGITAGSVSVDGGGPGIGFSTTASSVQYSVQGSAKYPPITPAPDKVRPFTVGCDGIACSFNKIRHAMNVTVEYKAGGYTVGDPVKLESPWCIATTKYI
ncbi:hypothetical protein GCM10010156_06120 [Planobispora rosea]|uniref:Fibronectin type-III domain-containing protein n=1 Tax=Planobispora rosea TaxID=35762 RepID=A0A8J3WDH6_PLARO|nr:LamG-like jellyroll fold domain-containing protein [Planobispora rosea]GGS50180.1 hypothetical protein GCM10010156_06120 [Planobispora rosea]GIH83896.1 hypothetical protein Pro02_23040 [Planobispora rosea]